MMEEDSKDIVELSIVIEEDPTTIKAVKNKLADVNCEYVNELHNGIFIIHVQKIK